MLLRENIPKVFHLAIDSLHPRGIPRQPIADFLIYPAFKWSVPDHNSAIRINMSIQ